MYRRYSDYINLSIYLLFLVHGIIFLMDDQTRADLEASTPLAWLLLNGAVNENQTVMEFDDHRFMVDIYADEHEDIVCKKSAQVGYTVLAILKCLWMLKYRGLNVIYVLPTQNLVKDFVIPKVNPLIYSNPFIKSEMESDRENLKSINKRFLYFNGAASEREAISKTADVLVLDEFDRMPDMSIVNTYDSRLQASKSPRRWRFSNPSQVGFGVDELYTHSDQRMWFVSCHQCGYKSYMDFNKDEYWVSDKARYSHYVDQDKKIYACGSCDKELSDNDRRMGDWISRFPDRKRHGYWINQMMAPWVTAERIMEQYEESSIDFFYNFVLGKAYTPSDMVVDREAIIRATAPSTIVKRNVSIGVDQDAGGQYYVAMTPDGVFDHGYVDSWEKIEHLKLMYNAVVVSDPNPYPTMPKIMAEKYSDWYMCYFKEMKGLDTIEFKGSVVYADRTRVIDIVANEIISGKLLFRQRVHEMEATMIKHWSNLYRTTEEKTDGRTKSTWIKKEDRQSDYPFALTYARIGLTKLMGGGSDIIEPMYDEGGKVSIHDVGKDGTITTDLSSIINETMRNI